MTLGRNSRRARLTVGFFCVAALTGACAPAVRQPPGPPRPPAGYEGRIDDLEAVDMTALAGRRIVLDPGHGGMFRGSMGVNGTTESEVNLGVALYLRGLLEARGAQVHMTRTDERDFVSDGDSSLRADLTERTRLAAAWNPDLFISIHHNADARGAHDVNETQTYYKLGDPGASLDAAESVHRYLVRNLGIRTHKILPGNYFVLRNTDAPALLTESSYITNPDVEARLVLASKQRLEAEAMLLGVAHFFARGAPEIESFVARSHPGAPPETTFSEIAAPVFEARVDGEFDHATLVLDGEPVRLERFDPLLEAQPAVPLQPGTHRAELHVRRSGRGAARVATLTFSLTRSPERLSLRAWPPVIGPRGGLGGVRIAVLDTFGDEVPESLVIRVKAPGATPRDTAIIARDGVGWAYFRVAPPKQPGTALAIEAALPGSGTPPHAPLSGRAEWQTTAEQASAPWTGFAQDAARGSALTAALGTREPDPDSRWINRDGFVVLPLDSTGAPRVPGLPGYRPLAREREADEVEALRLRQGGGVVIEGGAPWSGPLEWIAIAGGVLHGRRIVLDPDGGGGDAAGVGQNGTRAAHVNLRVARILRSFLEAAGASVRLTREGDFALSEVERVQISEAFGAERYLRIGHRAQPPRLAHFVASAAGRSWARRLAEVIQRFGSTPPPLVPDAQYPLQQTSCPALYAALARIDLPESEETLFEPGALRAEAYALYAALALEFTSDGPWPLDSLEVRDEGGSPVPGAAVTLGGGMLLETDRLGRTLFFRTEPGPIEARVEDSRVTARAILLDSTRGAVLTGSPGR